MKARVLFLLIVLVTSILVFTWGTTNYLRCSTDTPGSPEYAQCPINIDVFAMPAFIVTWIIIGIVPTLTWMITKNPKLRIIFTILSGIGIFFTFVGILILLIRF